MALVPASNATPRLRGAVFGLGMIGRHHARLLQQMDGVEFAGAVDPGGDRFGVVHDPSRIFGSAAKLLASRSLDFAVVAVPTEEHLPVTRELAAAGIHLLIEKPMAATADEARAIAETCASAGVRAAVGHVERFNPALLELRRRVQ